MRDLYPCPICLRALYVIEAIETGELTREHVPPPSLGGRWLALTYRMRNNDAGSFYDAEAEKQVRMRSFLAGKHQGLVRCTYAVKGVNHRGEMHLALSSARDQRQVPMTLIGAQIMRDADFSAAFIAATMSPPGIEPELR